MTTCAFQAANPHPPNVRRRAAALFVAVCLAAANLSAAIEYGIERLQPDDPRIHYDGRIDHSDPAQPVIIWQGSQIRFDFDGDKLAFLFSDVEGQVFFDLTIDDQTVAFQAQEGRVPCPIPLTDAPHNLTLFKRSEASAGTARFLGVQVSDSSDVYAPESPDFSTSFIFYGDSITAGACNEDPGEDQWEDRSTHNNAFSYGALTAKALNARYRNIAISGMGISVGYTEDRFPETWNRLYPDAESPLADVADYQPDYVFINLGENDDSFSKGQNQPFPPDYADRYVSMVREMRAAYPNARIVILRGGMYGGSQSERLREPWEEVVTTLEAEDSNLTHFVFDHWSGPHPRVADHEAMAAELIDWIQADKEG